ncbi:hypothetical protein L1887_58371 [Cichorium endivia]|nr:hypothetical protein L1887_58371 [Cichorium endivia]
MVQLRWFRAGAKRPTELFRVVMPSGKKPYRISNTDVEPGWLFVRPRAHRPPALPSASSVHHTNTQPPSWLVASSRRPCSLPALRLASLQSHTGQHDLHLAIQPHLPVYKIYRPGWWWGASPKAVVKSTSPIARRHIWYGSKAGRGDSADKKRAAPVPRPKAVVSRDDPHPGVNKGDVVVIANANAYPSYLSELSRQARLLSARTVARKTHESRPRWRQVADEACAPSSVQTEAIAQRWGGSPERHDSTDIYGLRYCSLPHIPFGLPAKTAVSSLEIQHARIRLDCARVDLPAEARLGLPAGRETALHSGARPTANIALPRRACLARKDASPAACAVNAFATRPLVSTLPSMRTPRTGQLARTMDASPSVGLSA